MNRPLLHAIEAFQGDPKLARILVEYYDDDDDEADYDDGEDDDVTSAHDSRRLLSPGSASVGCSLE